MSVGRHTIYNLTGSIVPMFVMLLTVPAYLHLVGNTRYGVLAIVWTFLGYFGMFDPGIGRAAAYHISRLKDGSPKSREDVFWTAMFINAAFGVLGGIVLFIVARPLFVWAFKMPPEMRTEVIASLPWLAASIPISILGNVLGGVLQAREWFGISNSVNILNAASSQLIPLIVAFVHGPDLTWLIPAILLTRAAGAVPTFLAVFMALPLGVGGRFRLALVKELFAYGGWITVTNLISPLLTSLDRLLIGSIVNTDAVAYYAVATQLVNKISVLPGAVNNSLFPRLSRESREESARLASDAVVELSALMTPVVIIGIVSMPILMRLWVGANFADHSAPVAMVILLGLWANGLAYIPYTHLQARNKPGVVAKFHMIEVIPFVGVLWFGLHFFGLIGAAWAMTLRVTVDAFLLFMISGELSIKGKLLLPGLLVLSSMFLAPSHIFSLTSLLALALIALSLFGSWMTAPVIRKTILLQINLMIRGKKAVSTV